MIDSIILPEMLEAGIEAQTQAADAQLTPTQTVIEIYLAMEGMRQIVMLRASEVVH